MPANNSGNNDTFSIYVKTKINDQMQTVYYKADYTFHEANARTQKFREIVCVMCGQFTPGFTLGILNNRLNTPRNHWIKFRDLYPDIDIDDDSANFIITYSNE